MPQETENGVTKIQPSKWNSEGGKIYKELKKIIIDVLRWFELPY